MTEKNVLIFQGGWDGHEPVKVAARFAKLMEKNGYTCKIYDNQEVLLDLDLLMRQDLIIPCWTMGKIDAAARANIVKAVAAGTGLAGCHGGMCDAFREDVEWQFMTGGQWVSHPGGDGISYRLISARDPALLWKVWRISRYAANNIICMWIRQTRFCSLLSYFQ
ncbi:MAG: ThuA domain-containing protein [Eisenbergiella massiliensis]